jgi:hypothetical protein
MLERRDCNFRVVNPKIWPGRQAILSGSSGFRVGIFLAHFGTRAWFFPGFRGMSIAKRRIFPTRLSDMDPGFCECANGV